MREGKSIVGSNKFVRHRKTKWVKMKLLRVFIA